MPGTDDVLRRILAQVGRRLGRYPFVRVRSGVGRGLLISMRNASGDYAAGTNELPVQRTLERLLRPGDVFYDVGSNVGFFTLIAARLVGPDGRVYSFEAVPANAERVRANAARNRLANVMVLSVAVGSQATGTVELLLTRHPGGASVAHDEVPGDVAGRMDVLAATVDGLVASGRIPPPTVVKIDVEGAELDVLAGMDATIAAYAPAMLVEFDGPTAGHVAAKIQALEEALAPHRYATTVLEPSYRMPDWHVAHTLAVSTRAVAVPHGH